MNDALITAAQECMDAAYAGTMTFPDIVGRLMANGFESYHIDYLRGTATYYHSNGGHTELPMPPHDGPDDGPVAMKFDAAAIQAAIREAQQGAASYTYEGFCRKVMAAGCAGYIASFPGRRVVYLGRTAETHVEHFPQ